MHHMLTLTSAPTVPSSLRSVPTKYNLIIRLWTHAFHRLLENLRRTSLNSVVALEHLQVRLRAISHVISSSKFISLTGLHLLRIRVLRVPSRGAKPVCLPRRMARSLGRSREVPHPRQQDGRRQRAPSEQPDRLRRRPRAQPLQRTPHPAAVHPRRRRHLRALRKSCFADTRRTDRRLAAALAHAPTQPEQRAERARA